MTVRVDAAGNLRGLSAGRIAAIAAPDHRLAPRHRPQRRSLRRRPRSRPRASPSLKNCAANISPSPSKSSASRKKRACASASPFSAASLSSANSMQQTLSRTDRNGVSVADAIRIFGLESGRASRCGPSRRSLRLHRVPHRTRACCLKAKTPRWGSSKRIVGQTRMNLIFDGQRQPRWHHADAPPARRHGCRRRMDRRSRRLCQRPCRTGRHGRQSRNLARRGQRHRRTSHRVARCPPRQTTRRATPPSPRLIGSANVGLRKAWRDRSQHAPQLEQPAVPMNPHLTALLQCRRTKAKFPSRRMTSGAGHDAMIVAQRLPCAMLFLRSPGGLSHHPDEAVLPQDVEAALATAMEFLTLLRDDKATPKDDHA